MRHSSLLGALIFLAPAAFVGAIMIYTWPDEGHTTPDRTFVADISGRVTGPYVLPDPALTPGAVATTDRDEICGRVGGLTYTKRHRVWHRRDETMAKYGVLAAVIAGVAFQDDDLVPVCLGGDNADPRNHWAQPSDNLVGVGNGYQSKDIMDAGACRMVCAGQVSLQEAQSWFLVPADWHDAYRWHFEFDR